MDLKLEGKRALITGAHKGTGKIIAQTLAEEGVQVALHSNEQEKAITAAGEIAGALPIWGDLSHQAGAEQAFKQSQDALGGLDILVNNLAVAPMGKWQTLEDQEWLEVYNQMVVAASRMIRLALPEIRQGGWGRIIQMGTQGSYQPNRIMPHYYAAKSALANMTSSLCLEVANSGITVNTVSPGLIHTEELEAGYRLRAQKKGWGSDWEGIVKQIVANDFPNPVGRLATRQEVADAVVFLCSPRADFISGQNLRVDGGALRMV